MYCQIYLHNQTLLTGRTKLSNHQFIICKLLEQPVCVVATAAHQCKRTVAIRFETHIQQHVCNTYHWFTWISCSMGIIWWHCWQHVRRTTATRLLLRCKCDYCVITQFQWTVHFSDVIMIISISVTLLLSSLVTLSEVRF